MKVLQILGYAFVIYLVVGTVRELTKQPEAEEDKTDKEPQNPKWNVN